MGQPDPGASWTASSPGRSREGEQVARAATRPLSNAEYDRLFRAAEAELDPVKRAALFIRMNDLVVSEHHILPLVYRPQVAGANRNLVLSLSGWANDLSSVHSWYRNG